MFSKFKNYLINLFLIFFLIKIYQATNVESRLKGEYKYQFQEHKTSIFQMKLVSCLSLISNSLKVKGGNTYLHQAIKKTKLDRAKFYEKYTIALITQCINNINQGQMEYLLIPENVDNYDLQNKTLLNLIKLEYEINNLELTYEENEINKAIEEILETNDKKKKKKNSSGILFFDLNTIIKIISFAIPCLLFLLYNSMRMMKRDHKKEIDEGTKELLELIKQRGKNSPNYKENNNNENNNKEEKNNDKGEGKEKKE